MGADEPEDLKPLYEQVCRRHDGIADFRAKLLALLPIASGAGIFLLVGKDGPTQQAIPHLLAIGAFGVLITLGLFIYELRGIQECNELIAAGRKLETKLSPTFAKKGAFNAKPPAALCGTVGATGAALLIYPAVVGAWVYVATVGAVETPALKTQLLAPAAEGGWAALAFGLAVLGQDRSMTSPKPLLFAVVVTYCLVLLTYGDTTLPLGLAVPYGWVTLRQANETATVSILAAAGVAAFVLSLLFDGAGSRQRVLAVATIAMLVSSVTVALFVTRTLAMSLVSSLPFIVTAGFWLVRHRAESIPGPTATAGTKRSTSGPRP